MRLRATRGLGAVLVPDLTLPNVDGTRVRLSDLLGRSLLTGAVVDVAEVANDRHKDHPRFHAGNFERNRDMATFVEAMAKRKRCKSEPSCQRGDPLIRVAHPVRHVARRTPGDGKRQRRHPMGEFAEV